VPLEREGRGPVEQALEGKTAEERGRLKATVHLDAKTPRSWTTEDGAHLKVEQKLLTPDGHLWVFLSSADWEVDPDGYYFVNPPVKVPDGTERDEVDQRTGTTRRVKNFKEDPAEAFRVIVTDAARHYHTHPEVWGRTTTTVFADTTDGSITSEKNVYATAAGAGGTLYLNNPDTTVLTVGQEVFPGPTYEVYEAFVQFDTSSIDDGDTIDSAVLSLDGNDNHSTTDFTAEAAVYDWGTSVTTADWRTATQLGALTRVATFASSGYSSGYNAFTSDAAFVSNVNKTGATRLIVFSARHRTTTTPPDQEYIFFSTADTAGTTSDPKLVVNHTVAAVHATVTPGVVATVAALPAASKTAGSTVTPAVISAPTTLPATGLSAGSKVTPAVISTPVALPAALGQANLIVTPAPVAAVVALPVASLLAGSVVTPAVLAALAALPATGLSAGSTVTPAQVAAVAALPQVIAAQGADVSPAVVAALVALPSVALSAGSTVTPAVLAALATLPQAGLSAGVRVTPGVVAAVAAVLQASLSAGATVTPATIATVVAVLQAAAYAAMKGRGYGGDALAFLTTGADKLAYRGHGTDAPAYSTEGRDS
jgi:hypothetical protein